MQRRALVTLGMLWLGGVPALAADAVDVRGVWTSVARTGEGDASGDQMIFTSRYVTLTEGILFDSSYAIDEDRITITPRDERHGPPQAGEFRIAGNKMTLALVGDRRRVMTRVGKMLFGSDPIIGDWTWPLFGNIHFVQRFSRNGASQLALPLEMDHGSYRIADGTLYLALARKGLVTLTARREGNVLTTRDPDGKEARFIKFEYDHLVV